MADMLVIVNSIGALENTTDVFVGGDVRSSDMTTEDATVYFQAQVSTTDLAVTINTAIKNAAITALANAGHTIGLLDKKTLLGGAVGL